MLGRQIESSFGWIRLTLTSIFGLFIVSLPNKIDFVDTLIYFLSMSWELGAKIETLGGQNERISSYVRMAQTSIFGLCTYQST